MNDGWIRVELPEVGDDFVREFLERITAQFRIGADAAAKMCQLFHLHGLRATKFKTLLSRFYLDGDFIGEGIGIFRHRSR